MLRILEKGVFDQAEALHVAINKIYWAAVLFLTILVVFVWLLGAICVARKM